jgi:predicted metalloprotease with PDZ domain
MTSLYDDFPLGDGGFTYADFRERLAAAGGDALAEQLDGWVYDTQPLPVEDALQSIGWVLEREDTSEDPVQVSLDVSLRGNPPVVATPRLDGAAWKAGINVGDELLALNGVRIGGNLDALLRRYSPGDEVEFTLFRDGLLKTLPVTLNPVRGDFEVEVDDEASEASEANQRLRAGWLSDAEEGDSE